MTAARPWLRRLAAVLCLSLSAAGVLAGAMPLAWAKEGGSGGHDGGGHGGSGSGGHGSGSGGGDDGGNSGSGSDSSGRGGDDGGGDDSGHDDGGHDDGGDSAGGAGSRDRVVPAELVIAAPAVDYRAIAALGLPIIRERRLDALGITVVRVRVQPPRDVEDALAAARRAMPDSEIGYNGLYALEGAEAAAPEAPQGQWPAQLLGWSAQAGTCAAGLRVGVIDTPLDSRAPGLQGAVIRPYGAADLDGSPGDSGHGTLVATLLVGRGSDMPGLVPGARLYHAAAAQSVGGKTLASATAIASALDWMVTEQVAVANISLAGPDTPLLREAVRRAAAAGLRLVAAAGNGGPGSPTAYPAAYPAVVGVAAVDRLGRLWPNSAIAGIALAAPGAGLPVAGPDGRPRHVSGTSYASPMAAGVLLSLSRAVPTGADPRPLLSLNGRPTDHPGVVIPQFRDACR